jgi:putative transposase
MASVARDRETGDRDRLAPQGLPTLVELLESRSDRATAGARRPPHDDSDMAEANPRWGAPRIHGELLKLGNDVSQATVAKYMGRRRSPPSQTWRTFLPNHVGQIDAADFFVVPTVTYRLVFVLVLLAHDRRRIRHVAVTTHPTAAWTAQQLREASPWDEGPRYL